MVERAAQVICLYEYVYSAQYRAGKQGGLVA